MRIAYFSPISPQKSGISDYSENELLPFLSRYLDIDVFIDQKVNPSSDFLRRNFTIYPYTDYEQLKSRYDIPVYHIGNNQMHEYIYYSLLKNPGISVLHEVFLHGLLWECTIGRSLADKYVEEFIYCYAAHGERVAQKAIQSGVYDNFTYPLIKRILEHSIGVICHNDFCVKTALKEKRDIAITKINLPVTIPDDLTIIDNEKPKIIKRRMKIENANPVIASFGFISKHKQCDRILLSFKKLLLEYPHAILLLVGEDMIGIHKKVHELQLASSVKLTGYVPFNKIIDYLSITDFCVNLRYPTAGETSASVLRIMASQKPVIVSDTGWFSEIPDNCCIKVPVDSSQEDFLYKCMKKLTIDNNLRDTLGSNAFKWVKEEHDPKIIAQKFYHYVKSVVDGNDQILSQVSHQLYNMGITEHDEDLIRYLSLVIKNLV